VDLALRTPANRGSVDDEHTAVLASLRRQVGLGDGRVMLTGGGVLGSETHTFFRRLRLPLSDIYGMSESTGPISWSPYDSPPGRVGRPMPGCDVRIDVDGEVLFRSRTAFAGYLNDPERTAETAAPDGFVRTGDIGEFDDDGWLRIVDRKKDLLITAGGKNIAPALLESALQAFPVIARVAVVGEQRPFVAALVTVDEAVARQLASAPDASLSDLIEHAAVQAAIDDALAAVNARFSRAEQIRRVVVLPEVWMPDSAVLTPTSKLKRRAVNDLYRDEIESLYATSAHKR
jgi:long-chain acyl-CoA synthetase